MFSVYISVEDWKMYRKMMSEDEAFIKNRKNFAAIINSICCTGRTKLRADDLENVEKDLLDSNAQKQIFPHYVRCITMHSPRGDIKLIQLDASGR